MPQLRPQEPTPSREAKLFRNNKSQAVRIPADFELPGDRTVPSGHGGKPGTGAKKPRRVTLTCHGNPERLMTLEVSLELPCPVAAGIG